MQSRDVNTMRNYIEQKLKDAQPVPTEPPPSVQQEPEEVINEPSYTVSNYTI